LVAGVDYVKFIVPQLVPKLEQDSRFIGSLDQAPYFDDIEKYVEDHDILIDAAKLLKHYYKQKAGKLYFTKMVEHDLIHVMRDPESNRRIPIVPLK